MKKALLVVIALLLLSGCGPGDITITTDPPGASVYVNGRHMGTSPIQVPNPIAIISVPDIHIKVDRAGYFPRDITVPLQHGKRTAQHIDLTPHPGSIDKIPSPELLSQMFGLSLWFGLVRETPPLWSHHVYEPALDALLTGIEGSGIPLADQDPSFPPDTIYRVGYEITAITPNVAISRPRLGSTIFNQDAHLMLVRDRDSWSILLPGFAFGPQGALEPIAYDMANVRAVFSIEELVQLAVNQRLGRIANTGRSRFIGVHYDDGVLEVHLNGDLSYGVKTAYLHRLTLAARDKFAHDAASIFRDVFLADSGSRSVSVVFHAPVFVDDYGNLEHVRVGTLSMTREQYERIVWDSIRPSMIVDLLETKWLY